MIYDIRSLDRVAFGPFLEKHKEIRVTHSDNEGNLKRMVAAYLHP